MIDSSLSPHILHSDTSWPSIFFLIQFILKVCSCTADIKSPASFFKQPLIIRPHFFSLLTFFCFSYKFTMKMFFFPLGFLSSFFCFLAVHTGPSYSGKPPSLLEDLNNLSSDWSRYRERSCSLVSTQSAMLRSPHPPSNLERYSLPVSL